MLAERTLAYGREVANALLGLDAHYRRESGDEDGLAVVNLDTEGSLAPEPFATYVEARRRFEALRKETTALPEPDRRAYYDALCHSTLAFVAWRTDGLTFAAQLADFLHVPAEPASDREIDTLEAALAARLHALGYTGDLRSRCAAWEEKNRVAPAEAASVLAGLLDAAWDRTERLLLPIPAPRSDAMRVLGVSGVPFNARCDYLRRTVELNTDPVLTRPGLKHLAVHEGCPGHYVQFKLRETLFREGVAPADVLLSVVNTASSSVFEGLGDAGLAMLEWTESEDDRVQAVVNRHRAGIGTAAAWRLHALGWPEAEVEAWLRGRALLGGAGWVANRMRFIAAPARAALIWSYWWGEPVVASVWARVPAARRPELLRYLHGRMHSNASIGMFE
jgi:hypothetical protein